jgi:hypothetical protein
MEEKYFETECNTETRITFSIMENETKEIV